VLCSEVLLTYPTNSSTEGAQSILRPEDVFGDLHHPNVAGHNHLASLVASFFDDVVRMSAAVPDSQPSDTQTTHNRHQAGPPEPHNPSAAVHWTRSIHALERRAPRSAEGRQLTERGGGKGAIAARAAKEPTLQSGRWSSSQNPQPSDTQTTHNRHETDPVNPHGGSWSSLFGWLHGLGQRVWPKHVEATTVQGHNRGDHNRQDNRQDHNRQDHNRTRPQPYNRTELPSPTCALVPEGIVKIVGWEFVPGRFYYSASAPNASLAMRFRCAADMCGVLVLLTRSYQPLGLVDIYIDEKLVAGRVSESDPQWVTKQAPMWTVLSLFQAIAPGSDQAGGLGLSRGYHTVRVVARGETAAAVLAAVSQTRGARSDYSRHAVHIRGVVTTYKPLPFILTWDGRVDG